MFVVKEYDLGKQKERIGYYQEVVDAQIQAKNNITTREKGYKHELPDEEKFQLNQDRAISRAKTKIRRLAQRFNMRYMWTLTFAETSVKTFNRVNGKESLYDTGNYDHVWRLWKSFLKRCSDNALVFDYIVTVEVQEQRYEEKGEKVYHFHFITNKVIPVNEAKARKSGKSFNMQSLWGHGHVFVTKKKSKKKLVHLYIVKYLAKLIDEMGSGRQRYRIANGMVVPVEIIAFESHTEMFTSIDSINIVKSRYSLLGDSLEIFWCIYDE